MQTQITKPVYVNSIELNLNLQFANKSEDIENYNLLCFDGYAIGSNGIYNVVMKYPKLWELSDEQINDVMSYGFGSDWKKDKDLTICFSDVMMLYGRATQIQQVNTI